MGLSGIGVAALILSAFPPLASALDLTNGPAEVTLPACAQGTSQTDTFIPGCNYIRLANKAAPAYTYLTSQGAVSWRGGTLAGSSLSFPAAGQTSPALTDLFVGASTVMTPKDVTGTIDANGKVDLTMGYDLLFATARRSAR